METDIVTIENILQSPTNSDKMSPEMNTIHNNMLAWGNNPVIIKIPDLIIELILFFLKDAYKNDKRIIDIINDDNKDGGSSNMNKRNPMDYHVRKYLQSGGYLNNKTKLQNFVKDILTTHPKLEKRVIDYCSDTQTSIF